MLFQDAPTLTPRASVIEERGRRAVGREARWSMSLGRRGRAVGARRSAFLAAAVVATVVPQGATTFNLKPARVHPLGARTRLSMSTGLGKVQEQDFLLPFRMTVEEFRALHAAVAPRLLMDEGMATLLSGSPIPTEFGISLGLRTLAGVSYLKVHLTQ